MFTSKSIKSLLLPLLAACSFAGHAAIVSSTNFSNFTSADSGGTTKGFHIDGMSAVWDVPVYKIWDFMTSESNPSSFWGNEVIFAGQRALGYGVQVYGNASGYGLHNLGDVIDASTSIINDTPFAVWDYVGGSWQMMTNLILDGVTPQYSAFSFQLPSSSTCIRKLPCQADS